MKLELFFGSLYYHAALFSLVLACKTHVSLSIALIYAMYMLVGMSLLESKPGRDPGESFVEVIRLQLWPLIVLKNW